jgi:hypothetical protein
MNSTASSLIDPNTFTGYPNVESIVYSFYDSFRKLLTRGKRVDILFRNN